MVASTKFTSYNNGVGHSDMFPLLQLDKWGEVLILIQNTLVSSGLVSSGLVYIDESKMPKNVHQMRDENKKVFQNYVAVYQSYANNPWKAVHCW